jgi:hypothetical protein
MIPFGKKAIEKDITKVISDILDIMVPRISNSDVYICGTGDARRMLGRKLEDRLKRVVKYT